MPGPARLPDLVFVVFDTARADAFTPYGAAPEATPVFSALAEEGQAVPAAFTTANWTLPAHASMFTGLLPRQLGLAQSPGGLPQGARPAIRAFAHRSLPVTLQAAGYQTIGVSANAWVSKHTGFDSLFEKFTYVGSPRGGRASWGWRNSLSFAAEALLAETDDGLRAAEAHVGAAVGGADPRRPLFLFVNLVECHSPYLPPRPYNDLGALNRLRAGREAQRHLSVTGIWRASAGDFSLSQAALGRMRHLYGRAIRSLDDWLGRLLSLLRENRRLSRTWLLVTSDHGENLGEGRLLGHAFSLDDRLMHVPLLIHGAGAPRLPAGPVSLATLPRVLADALELADHPWRESLPTDVAVAQQDGLASIDDPRIVRAALEWGVGMRGAQRMSRPLTAVRDERFKLLSFPGGEEIYDLANDPLELTPLEPGRLAGGEVHNRLSRLRAATDHPAVRAVTTWGQEPSRAASESAAEAAELRRTLRTLGYL